MQRIIVRTIVAVAICLAVGFIAGYATAHEIGAWYVNLNKPSFNPPNYIFGPVWTVLYILMGLSWAMVMSGNQQVTAIRVNGIFLLQLLLNFTWSFLFFMWHRPDLALINIILLWIALIMTIFIFAKISKAASLLLVPYLLWLSFAVLLNYSIWQLN